MAIRVCTSEDCPCSSHNLRYLLYIGEFVLYTRDLVSGTEAEERGRKVEKVLSHGGIRLEPKVLFWSDLARPCPTRNHLFSLF